MRASNFKSYYKAPVLQIVNSVIPVQIYGKTESPEIDPHKYDQLSFDKDSNVINRAQVVFSAMVLE